MNRRPHVRRVAGEAAPVQRAPTRAQRRAVVIAPRLRKERHLVRTRWARRARTTMTLLPFPRCMCRDGAKAAVHFVGGNGNGRRKKLK